MSILNAVADALGWLGRHGTPATALAIFAGLFLPGIGALCKPLVPEAIFALLVLAFLRVDPLRLRAYFARPALVGVATLWTMVAMPAAVGLVLHATGLGRTAPALVTAVMIQVATAPILSGPAFAALMGLDTALALATLLLSMAITPLTMPLFIALFVGPDLVISPVAIGLKLFALLAGSALTAAVVRRLCGASRLEARRASIDGASVVLLFIFAGAVMDGVLGLLVAHPARVLGFTLLAFAISLGMLGLTTFLFVKAGRARAFAIGICVAHRNMGLLLAASGAALPDTSWLYSGLVQFPIYLTPQLLMPLARRLLRDDDAREIAQPGAS